MPAQLHLPNQCVKTQIIDIFTGNSRVHFCTITAAEHVLFLPQLFACWSVCLAHANQLALPRLQNTAALESNRCKEH